MLNLFAYSSLHFEKSMTVPSLRVIFRLSIFIISVQLYVLIILPCFYIKCGVLPYFVNYKTVLFLQYLQEKNYLRLRRHHISVYRFSCFRSYSQPYYADVREDESFLYKSRPIKETDNGKV